MAELSDGSNRNLNPRKLLFPAWDVWNNVVKEDGGENRRKKQPVSHSYDGFNHRSTQFLIN